MIIIFSLPEAWKSVPIYYENDVVWEEWNHTSRNINAP
jgi:hypothetical protein